MADGGSDAWAEQWLAWSQVDVDTRVEHMRKIAAKAASRYMRAAQWMGRDELEQTAVADMIGAHESFDPTRGVDFGALMWRVAISAIRRAVLKARSPASASCHDAVELREHRREPVEDDTVVEAATPESDVAREELCARIRARLTELVGAEGVPFTIGVLTKEFTPREIADQHGVSVQHVYRLQQRVRLLVYRDLQLFTMWQQEMNAAP